ncbi:MAG: hypothetical protein KDD70_06320 [Bdellovibrionales bacterium]|nr:hypothetical protein [Bdellovibrionales bacterium]
MYSQSKYYPLEETHLYELGFAVPAEGDMEAFLAAPAPVELEDRKGRSWAIYRHLEYPRDLQLWLARDGTGKIRLRKLGRLREKSYEFETASSTKLFGKLKQAITELSDLPDLLNG